MCKLFFIFLIFLGVNIFGEGEYAHSSEVANFEITDTHQQQLECCHRHNIDAERTLSVVVPSARTSSTTSSRQAQQRLSNFTVVEHFATTNYPTIRFIHRLGSCARAVDYYLYILCQLRL